MEAGEKEVGEKELRRESPRPQSNGTLSACANHHIWVKMRCGSDEVRGISSITGAVRLGTLCHYDI